MTAYRGANTNNLWQIEAVRHLRDLAEGGGQCSVRGGHLTAVLVNWFAVRVKTGASCSVADHGAQVCTVE